VLSAGGLRQPPALRRVPGPAFKNRVPGQSTAMRVGTAILLIWLIIGAVAAGQRHYYDTSSANCAGAGTIVVTILAGPLNYVGVNPKISCHLPEPSK
jgi:hypothetical protein